MVQQAMKRYGQVIEEKRSSKERRQQGAALEEPQAVPSNKGSHKV